MANKNKPALRFKGFEEEWEEKKLGEECIVTMGQSPDGKNYTNNPNDNILVQGNADLKNGKVVPRIWTTQITKTAIVGDLIFTVRAPVGDVGKTNYNVVLGRGVAGIMGNEFIFQSLLLKKNNEYWKKFSAGSTFDSINSTELYSTNLFVPQLPEQTQIGTYFKNLDALIALQEEKLAKLQNLKKAMLEKMFPAANADIPEIRFKGFTDKWEKKKLGEVCSNTYGGGTPSTLIKEYWDGNIPWIQSSDLSEGEVLNVTIRKRISQKGLNNSATKLVPKKSIAIITRVGVGKLALVPFEFATSQDFLSLSNLNIDILFGVFSIGEILKKELHKVQGTSIKGITKDELLIKNILVPKDKSEQQKIGNYFQNLDQAIAQSGQKITQLKNLKQALLQKMFV